MARNRSGEFRRALAALLLTLAAGRAAAVDELFGARGGVLEVGLNKSEVIELTMPVQRVSVGNPEVADILMPTPRQIYVVGKSLGSTNVVLWSSSNRVVRSFDVEVVHDLEGLKRKLNDLMPDEPIEVRSAQSAIVLSGSASSVQKSAAAADLARSFIGPGKEKESRLLNLVQVGGAQQVMLEVQVAEIARELRRRLGIKFHALGTDSYLSFGAVNGSAGLFQGAALPGEGMPLPHGTTGVLHAPLVVEDKGLLFSFMDGKTLFNAVIEAAQEDGLAKVLAEPTLTTLNGEEAKFHAGGEFPIPVGEEDGKIVIEFKKFGVSLGFVPVVLESDRINLKVSVTVSEISTKNAFTLTLPSTTTFFAIPSLTSRSASSSLELGNGQTMAIAGLISEELREQVEKFPGLGDLPLLGHLFRSQEFIKGQTELVILVTPHFAKPQPREAFRLPTDSFVEPQGAEFYLFGVMEGQPQTGRLDTTGMEGSFGHGL